MGYIIGLLTLVLVLDCAALILLVLVQLPKKDAGAGLAFGGAATDALFGAGSGNVLTQITKYAATTFFILAVVLSIMQSKYYHRTTSEFEQKLGEAPRAAALPTTPATTPVPTKAPAAAATVPLTSTNLLSQPAATNSAAK